MIRLEYAASMFGTTVAHARPAEPQSQQRCIGKEPHAQPVLVEASGVAFRKPGTNSNQQRQASGVASQSTGRHA